MMMMTAMSDAMDEEHPGDRNMRAGRTAAGVNCGCSGQKRFLFAREVDDEIVRMRRLF